MQTGARLITVVKLGRGTYLLSAATLLLAFGAYLGLGIAVYEVLKNPLLQPVTQYIATLPCDIDSSGERLGGASSCEGEHDLAGAVLYGSLLLLLLFIFQKIGQINWFSSSAFIGALLGSSIISSALFVFYNGPKALIGVSAAFALTTILSAYFAVTFVDKAGDWRLRKLLLFKRSGYRNSGWPGVRTRFQNVVIFMFQAAGFLIFLYGLYFLTNLVTITSTEDHAITLILLFVCSPLIVAATSVCAAIGSLGKHFYQHDIAGETWPRPFAIFLRPFQEDEREIFETGRDENYTLSDFNILNAINQFNILEVFDYVNPTSDFRISRICQNHVAPLYSVRNPGQTGRSFFELGLELEPKNWKVTVESSVVAADLIIVKVGAASGAIWEIEKVVEHRRLHDTIFVFPAALRTDRIFSTKHTDIGHFSPSGSYELLCEILPEDSHVRSVRDHLSSKDINGLKAIRIRSNGVLAVTARSTAKDATDLAARCVLLDWLQERSSLLGDAT